MATINCPHHQRWILHLVNSRVMLEDRTIQIFNGVCNSCDRCGVRDCEYFDDTEEGTRSFIAGLSSIHASLECRRADRELEAALRQKHKRHESRPT